MDNYDSFEEEHEECIQSGEESIVSSQNSGPIGVSFALNFLNYDSASHVSFNSLSHVTLKFMLHVSIP